MLYCIVLYYIMVWLLCSSILCYIMLYYIMLYYIILYYIILWYIIVYYVIQARCATAAPTWACAPGARPPPLYLSLSSGGLTARFIYTEIIPKLYRFAIIYTEIYRWPARPARGHRRPARYAQSTYSEFSYKSPWVKLSGRLPINSTDMRIPTLYN